LGKIGDSGAVSHREYLYPVEGTSTVAVSGLGPGVTRLLVLLAYLNRADKKERNRDKVVRVCCFPLNNSASLYFFRWFSLISTESAQLMRTSVSTSECSSCHPDFGSLGRFEISVD